MADSGSKSRGKFARDLVALDDVELDQYLEENRIQGGATVVHVEDPENLPESFIRRLRDRAQRTNNSAESQAVDLNQVNTRLLELPANYNSLPRPLFRAPGDDVPTEPPTPEDVRERRYYNQLLNNGGRPLYPIHRLDDVASDPEAHRDMLRPWRYDYDANIHGWEVFWEQFHHWMRFRRWQEYNRRVRNFGPAQRETDNSFISDFRRKSSTYTEAITKLLAHYGFTWSFHLHDDLKEENKLTTWIEYLAFTYSSHYEYTLQARRMQPVYNEAWQKLLDAKVLRPSETEEYICDINSAFGRQSEKDRAWRTVKLAEAATISVRGGIDNPGNSRDEETANTTAHAAQSRLDTAKILLSSIERRNRLIAEFKASAREYLVTTKKLKYYDHRLKWVLDQVPLVEAEMTKSSASETKTNSVHSVKKKDEQDTGGTQISSLEKQRLSTQKPNCSLNTTERLDCQNKWKRTYDDNIGEMQSSAKRPRNSTKTPVSHNPHHAKTELSGERQGSMTSMTRTDGNKRAVMESLRNVDGKLTKASNDRLPRKRSHRTPQPSQIRQPPRRSARIAARQQVQREAMMPTTRV